MKLNIFRTKGKTMIYARRPLTPEEAEKLLEIIQRHGFRTEQFIILEPDEEYPDVADKPAPPG